MKRQRHIRTHVMATLIGLTCGVLLVVILAFNLSVRGQRLSSIPCPKTPLRCGTVGCATSGGWSPS